MSTVTKKDLRNYYNRKISQEPHNNYLIKLREKIPDFYKLIKQTRDINIFEEKDNDYVAMYLHYERLKILFTIRNGCKDVEVIKKLYDDLTESFRPYYEVYELIKERHRQELIFINNRVPESNKIAPAKLL